MQDHGQPPGGHPGLEPALHLAGRLEGSSSRDASKAEQNEADDCASGVAEPPSHKKARLDPDASGNAPESIPETYTRFGGEMHGLSAKWMKLIFSRLEPVSLGHFAIRALIQPKQREIDLRIAGQLLEYMTGLDESTPITGALRVTENLMMELKARNEANGRPARELPLPPNWDLRGWYKIDTHCEASLWLELKTSDGATRVQVMPESMGLTAGAAFLSVSIDRNFSRVRAELVDSTRMRRAHCQNLIMAGSASSATSAVAKLGPGKTPSKEEAQPVRAPERVDESKMMAPPPTLAKEEQAGEPEAKVEGNWSWVILVIAV